MQSKSKLVSDNKIIKVSLPTSPILQNEKQDGKTRFKEENSEIKQIRSSIQNQQSKSLFLKIKAIFTEINPPEKENNK